MKNPWLSMWLSAANSTAGAARGFWMAEFQRQQRAMARTIADTMTPDDASSRTRGRASDTSAASRPAKRRAAARRKAG